MRYKRISATLCSVFPARDQQTAHGTLCVAARTHEALYLARKLQRQCRSFLPLQNSGRPAGTFA